MEQSGVILARDVHKNFGAFQALKGISLTVRKGEIYGFIGRNGAGKTTFMRIVCGLMKPSRGEAAVTGRFGFLPQNVRFRDKVSANEMVNFFARLREADPAECMKFLSLFQINLNKAVRDLSPGQQRKLQLAIATIGMPDLLVLDEPTAGLDPMGVQQVREMVRTLHGKGCTLFISSHVLLELDQLCSHVAVIEQGEVIYRGACNPVYEIEIDEPVNRMAELLPDIQKTRCRILENRLLADIERNEVPELLETLYERGIKVFGVKRQGLETLYRDLLKGGA